jgi:hypothetical protein
LGGAIHKKPNKEIKMTIRVSYKFAKLPDKELNDFATKIDTNMTGNAVFPTPPADATLAMLNTANADFSGKLTKAATGGPPDTAAKDASRQVLLGILRKLAGYVQITASNMEELLSSGFEAMSQNRAQSALEQPTGLVIKNGTTGQLIASLSVPVKNTSIYEGRASKDGGSTWPQTCLPAIPSTSFLTH